TVVLGQLRHEKAAPSDLFTQNCRAVTQHVDRCSKNEIESNTRPDWHRAETEVLGDLDGERPVVEAGKPCEPDKAVNCYGVAQRDEIANNFIAALAPLPSQARNVSAEALACEQSGNCRAPHETSHISSAARAEMACSGH